MGEIIASPRASRPAALRERRLSRRSLAVMLGVLSLVVALFSPASPAMAANPSDGFQPGNIISDANFYDGNSVTTAQVQQFLNQQVPSCWLGRPGYEIGKPVYWGGQTQLASKCLKDFTMTTTTEPANAYCSGMPGVANESAASIITRVGQACGISPKVLLVMLDKEQSLVSDPWPNENQYYFAMGYACPDTGPGGSGVCDPSLGGFAKQVYRAAWQYKVYKAFPQSFNYKPFQTNSIQYHPNQSLGCGSAAVYIENWATAALYIYTPYVPNQAALNAGWGTGDSCSSYGNRNFYNYYKAWFGSPVIAVDGHLSGAAAGLGAARANPVYLGGGVAQDFEGGMVAWHPSTGVVYIVGGIREKLVASGGVDVTGLPEGNEIATATGWMQTFQYAVVSWAGSTGGVISLGGIASYYKANGSHQAFGLPIQAEAGRAGGWYQNFELATLTWAPGVGGGAVRGGIREFYFEKNGPETVGYPAKLEVQIGDGWYQDFERGTVAWSPAGSGFIVGGIRDAYFSYGGPAVLGYPLGAERTHSTGVWIQDFQNGSVVWSIAGGSAVLQGGLRDVFAAQGTAFAGVPKGQPTILGDGMVQEFTGGLVGWSPAGGPAKILNGIKDAYLAYGGPAVLGYPIGVERTHSAGVWIQDFQNGSVLWSVAGGPAVVKGGLKDMFATQGTAFAGVPKGQPTILGDGMVQEFTGGLVGWSPSGGPAMIVNGVKDAYLTYGGPSVLGYPLGAERMHSSGVWIQDFQNGSALWSTVAGSAVVQGGLRDAFTTQGTAFGGVPIGRPTVLGDGMVQEFTGATAAWRPSTGPIVVVNGIRAGYLAYGGVATLGLPKGPEHYASPGVWEQEFDHGTVTWTNGVGIGLRR